MAHSFSALVVFCFVAGVAAAQQFRHLPSLLILCLAWVVTLGLRFFRFKLVAVFLFGLVWALTLAAWRMADFLPFELERKDVRIEGRVVDVPDALDGGLRFGFQVDRVLEPAGATVPRLLRLSWFREVPVVKAGEHWRLGVRLKRPHGFFNPGGMDYELWLFSQGIRATGYVREDASNQRLGADGPFSLPAWRQAVYERLQSSLAGRSLAGVVMALTMGAENAITPDQWEVLRRTGTAHLVAISGSHVSLIAGLVFLLVRRLCAWGQFMRWAPQTVAATTAVLAVLAYSALADFSLPTQRALIMIFIVMGGIIHQRNLSPAHTLLLALSAVLFYDPWAVLSAGFWLSFGAVALILLVVNGRLRSPGWWASLWNINWATSLGLAPLLLVFFQQVSLVSPLANLIAVPTIGFVLTPLCLVGALALSVYEPLGVAVLGGVETLLAWVWVVLQWLSDWPWAQWRHASPPLWTLVFAVLGTALLLAPKGIPSRCLGLVLLVPALTARPPLPEEGRFRLTLLDLGQGLGVVVETHGHLLVFDAGPQFSQSFDAGEAVVEPYLRQQGASRIHRLVISHGDNDHIGGAASLLRLYPVDAILSSVPHRLPGAEPCQAGQAWVWDGVRFEMLSPAKPSRSDNDDSCVLKISTVGYSALLTGDMEKAVEMDLLGRYGQGLASELLIAPHHGSNTSSSAPFLAAVHPAYVLIALGHLNRYQFPHPEVLRRYAEIDAQVFDSAHHGAITVESGVSPPIAYRLVAGHYWNNQD